MRETKKSVCRAAMALLATAILFPGGVYAQQSRVTLDLKNVSLIQALRQVRQQAETNFVYSDEELQHARPVSVTVGHVTVEEALNRLLRNQPYTYEKDAQNVYVIKPLNSARTNGNRKTVYGKVVDETTGEPLIGATVVDSQRQGGVTSMDGSFAIDVPANCHQLTVSFMGYEARKVSLHGTTAVVAQLRESAKALEDVVINGYSTVRKTSFTGSSTQISGDELRKVSQTNILDAMQTFDPSFRLVTNTQFGSDPNALPEMYIRGRSGVGVRDLDKSSLSKSNLENNPNLPTFIMDGFEVSIEKVYDLDPARIESMTILKDAAATAIYGSRAANGVVVITTVTPKPGEVRVSYNFTGTLEMPDLRDYNLANASEKLEIERLAGVFDNSDFGQSLTDYNKKYAQIQRGVDTDWLSIPLRNAFDHKHSVYIEGGTQNLRYGVDASYNGTNGVMKGSSRNRYSIGFSLDYRMESLQVKNTVSFTHSKSEESPYGSFSDYTQLEPYDTPYEDDGTLKQKLQFSQLSSGRTANNPLYEATLANYDWDSYDEITNNLSANWYITNEWTLKGRFSLTRKYSTGEKFIDPLSAYTSVSSSSNTEDAHKLGDLYTDTGNAFNWSGSATLYYTKSINDHNINMSASWEASASTDDATSAHYRGFPNGQFHSLNYASEIYKKPTKAENSSRMVSAFASANYTWNDIYLADLSVRFDGSSDFGANQRWAPFFSGGLGVNIHNFSFMKENKTFNQLKVRGSYGRTGKVNFPSYSATTMYEMLYDEWYATGFGAVLKALGNKNLTWEKTDKFDVGIEAQLFDKRLTVDADYYYERTMDLVNDVTLSNTSGFSTYKDNTGEVVNKGFELQLRYDLYRSKNWIVALWGNMAHNENKILKISDSQRAYNQRVREFYMKEITNQNNGIATYDAEYAIPISQYEEGQSLTSIWAVKSLGIDPTTGKEIFLNRDGTVSDTWDASQEVVVGNTEPKFNGSVGFNISWKQWSLFTAFQYEWGGQEYNQTLVDRVENARIPYQNVDLRVLTDRWKKPGDVAQFKDIKDANYTTLPTSRFVQDNSYLRLSALTLSYDFDRDWIKHALGMNMLRIEASTRDFINWNSIRQERGLSYPKSWTVDLSIKAQF